MKLILIVDDLPDNLYLLSTLLKANGYNVVEANHGAAALALAKENTPDLIISDLLMPVMDGYTLLKEWKADEQLKHIPFIVYTATYTDSNDEKLALNLGADAYIVKPEEPGQFMIRINEILKKDKREELLPAKNTHLDEKVILKQYSEVLIRKLEQKTSGLELANARLEQENIKLKQMEESIKHSNTQLRQLTAHLQNVREEERKRIAREIHDELGQELTAIKMDIAWIDKKTPQESALIKEKLNNIKTLLTATHQSIRKILIELRTGILDDFGLQEALNWQSQQFTLSTGIPVLFNTSATKLHLNEEISNCFFRLYQESLTNIMRYAEATEVSTSLSVNNGNIILHVEDDGKGFDTNIAPAKNSFGILGMKERAYSMKGTFDLQTSPGKGTKITVSIPYRK